MKYLITQSLVASWNYMTSCREEFQYDAYLDFLDALYRVPKKTTLEMKNGVDFENEVYKAAAGVPRVGRQKWEKGVNAVASLIKGAAWQVKASRELSVGSTELLVYGVIDALKAGVIYDVKFSNKSFGQAELAGKYLDSPQHPAYFYIEPEAREFRYLVSDGTDLYTETYTRENSRPFQEIAAEFLKSLKTLGLLSIYKDKWVAKR